MAAGGPAAKARSASPHRLASRSPTPHKARVKFKADGTEVSYAPPSPLPPLLFDQTKRRTPTPEIGVGRLGDWPAHDGEAPKPLEKRASLKPGPQGGAIRKVSAVDKAKNDKAKGGKGKGRGNARTKGSKATKKREGAGKGKDRKSREDASSGGGDSQWEES